MKKLLISIAAALTLTTLTAAAAQLEAVNTEGTVKILQSGDMSDMLVAAYYDKDGSLINASRLTAADGEFTFELPDDYSSVRIFDIGKETYDVDLVTATAEPEITEATAAPLEEAAQAPSSTRRPLNPSYPEEVDQVLAPAVIKKVMNSSGDGTDQYIVSALLQGQEAEISVDIDTVIKNTPSAYSSLRGGDASVLRKGDVVYFLTNIKGDKVRSIDLLYRPTDVFKNSGSFNSLYTGGSSAQKAVYGSRLPSDRAYVLGVITSTSNGTLTLYPVTGAAKDAFEIPYTKDTVTYIYDLSSKNDPYIAESSDISRSAIPKRAYDDNDDISSLSDYDCNFAFVRTVDREAVDIVVYEYAED